jgi:hypothetical protein
MRLWRNAALALLALAGAAGSGRQALAEPAPARSGTISTSTALGNVKVLRDLQQFGRCFAATDRKSALALIATKPLSKEEGAVYRRLATFEQNCLFSGTRMFSSVVYIRGAIAEGLLGTGGVPPELLLPAPRSAAEVTSLSETARCYVAGHRAEVQALMKMKPGDREEVAAIGALWNGFRTCLPKRANVRLNALWIRYLLAEALLRTSGTAAPAGGG